MPVRAQTGTEVLRWLQAGGSTLLRSIDPL
jgi:hypothetical protein